MVVRPNADDKLVRHGRLRVQKPRNAADFRVSGNAHVVERECELLVGEAHRVKRNFLNRHSLLQELGLCREIRIVRVGQFAKVLIDLDYSQVPLEAACGCRINRLPASRDIVLHRMPADGEGVDFRGLQCVAANKAFFIGRPALLARPSSNCRKAVQELRQKRVNLALVSSLAQDRNAKLLRCKRPLIVGAIAVEPPFVPDVRPRAAWIKDEIWSADGFRSEGPALPTTSSKQPKNERSAGAEFDSL